LNDFVGETLLLTLANKPPKSFLSFFIQEKFYKLVSLTPLEIIFLKETKDHCDGLIEVKSIGE